MSMITKLCTFCGVTGPHNSMFKKDEWRCVFCGHPPKAASGSSKREHQELMRARQANKARIAREGRGY